MVSVERTGIGYVHTVEAVGRAAAMRTSRTEPGRSKMEKGHGPFLCRPVEAEKKRKGMIE